MNAYTEKIEFVVGNAGIMQKMGEQRPYEIFAEQTIDFLNGLAVVLRQNEKVRSFPDVAAFGFWCRRASVLEMKKKYADCFAKTGRAVETDCGRQFHVGRGVSLHFVSSNIPVLFGFSMAAAILAGNGVLVRLPSKQTLQETLIVDALQAAMEELPIWKKRIVLFRSPHDREITDALSALCDVRVIWGGDRAVREIRQSPLPPRALELPFADRRSAAVFLASAVLETEDLTALVRAFYNDTYRNDQNACSSPHLLYWLGEETTVRQAQARFWDAVEQKIHLLQEEKSVLELEERKLPAKNPGITYQVQPAIAVKKWEQALYLAAVQEEQGLNAKEAGNRSAVRISKRGNLAVIVEPARLSARIWEQTVPGGFFFQSFGTDLRPLIPALSRKVQTLACFGVNWSELAAQLVEAGAAGVDRIVEVGHALDFSLVWDGMDLIGQMSRAIEV